MAKKLLEKTILEKKWNMVLENIGNMVLQMFTSTNSGIEYDLEQWTNQLDSGKSTIIKWSGSASLGMMLIYL